MSAKIYSTDNANEIASKIYFNFDVLDSCCVYGFEIDMKEQKLMPKGEMVMAIIEKLYQKDFINSSGNRKYKTFGENVVGGPVAHKAFKFDKKIVEMEPRYIIWRLQ